MAASGAATCGGCANTWTTLSRCHCAACHRSFSGEVAFDAHRRDIKGTGTCLDPEKVTRTNKETGAVSRALFLTDGVWSSVENPVDRAASLKAWRASQTKAQLSTEPGVDTE